MSPAATDTACYRIFDFALESDFPLPELEAHPGGEPAIRFTIDPQSAPEEDALEWLHEWTLADGQVTISSARHAGGYLLRFPGLADFLVTDNGREIACPAGGCPASTIRHLLLDQVIPRVVGHRGRLVAHAGCVELEDGRAVAFLGSTGWGKSTLTAAFVVDGARLVTDDCLLIEVSGTGARCIPSYAGLRLLPGAATEQLAAGQRISEVAHYSAKRRFQAAKGTRHGFLPLAAVFQLNDPAQADTDGEIRIEQLSGATALIALLASAFTLDISDRRAVTRHFETTGSIGAAGLPFFRLNYPREIDRLPEVLEAVRNCGSGTARRSPRSNA
jgi:hypothetical protein